LSAFVDNGYTGLTDENVDKVRLKLCLRWIKL
jgi:hypothetical protein